MPYHRISIHERGDKGRVAAKVQFLSLLGILAIAERFIILKWYHPVLAVLFLLVAGLYLFYSKIGFPALKPMLIEMATGKSAMMNG